MEPSPAPAPAPVESGAVEPSLDLEALSRAERELADVERALARLDAGTYDVCETCGGAVGDDRLLADPTVRTCATHA